WALYVPGRGSGSESLHVSSERSRSQVASWLSDLPAASRRLREAPSPVAQSRLDQMRSDPLVMSSSRLASPTSTVQPALPVLVTVTAKEGRPPSGYVVRPAAIS